MVRHRLDRPWRHPMSLDVAREVLRVSLRPQGWMTLFQFVFLNGGMAVFFGLSLSPWRPLAWMALVGAGSLVYVFTPQPLPAPGDERGLVSALRRHTAVVGVHAFAHGSAGFFLFDTGSFAQSQALLAAIMLGMLVAFIEFVSRYRYALQLATVLIVLPTTVMMVAFMRGSLLIMAVLLAAGLPMMLVLVGRRSDVFENIIQRQIDESQLRQTTQEALAQVRIAQQDKLRFFAAANHDLRQPIMAIGVHAELLRRQLDAAHPDAPASAPGTESLRSHVEALWQAQRGLNGLVDQLLDIDQLESAEAPPRLGPVLLMPLLARQVQLHQAAAVRDGARIVLRCTPLATVFSHALQLERIVSNLLDNAVKFTPGGTILVACRRRGDRWRIEVRDSGIGIPLGARDLVFRDFEQLANPERDQKRGHGLGLAIVKRVAAQLGTSIELRTAPGRGSVFAFELAQVAHAAPPTEPGAPLLAPSPAVGMSRAEAPNPPLRILVVEDDQGLADSLAALLHSDAMRAVICTDGHEALAAADLENFDLALCDVRLPGPTDGFALALSLETRRPAMPIVLMSADVDRRMLERATEAGWTLMRKPVAAPVLLQTVRHLALRTGGANGPVEG